MDSSSRNPENRIDYDIFVCYYEDTGKDFATMIHRALTQRGYKVFVAHIERPYMTGDFRSRIDSIIDNCHTFVLLNTIGALERDEVKREVTQAFPNGVITKHEFWIFREDESDVPRGTSEFETVTKINLSSQNQSDFSNDAHLARSALRKCNKKREVPVGDTTATLEKTAEISHDEYSEFSMISHFAEQMKKKGFTAEIEKNLGSHIRTDLILQKDDRVILCEFKKSAESVRVGVLGTILLYKSELEY